MGLFRSEPAADPDVQEKYLLHVTAGPAYDTATHTTVPVNTPSPLPITSPLTTTHLSVRIDEYHGLPLTSPESSPYFSHTSDRFSIAFSFVPSRPIRGPDLLMGFDVAHPVRDRLPPGTKAAVKIVTGVLDPGLSADPYADEPYVYGPALSSFFALRVGERESEVSLEEQVRVLIEEEGGVTKEGASGSGCGVREGCGMPGDVGKRRKFFLDKGNLEGFVFEEGRVYHADFCNPHLDFAGLALRVPGLKVGVKGYVGEKTHQLRFVLKEKREGSEEVVGFVVAFTLLFGKELEEALKREKGGKGKGGEKGVRQEKEVDGHEKKRDVGKSSEQSSKPPTDTNVSAPSQPPTSASTSTRSPAPAPSKDVDSNGTESDITTEPPSALNNATSALRKSISNTYTALGFGTSSDSPASDQDIPSPPSSASERLDAQVDEMSDKTVAEYLQNRNSSLR